MNARMVILLLVAGYAVRRITQLEMAVEMQSEILRLYLEMRNMISESRNDKAPFETRYANLIKYWEESQKAQEEGEDKETS